MTAYLSFEWQKFSKRWMPRVILLMMLALTVLVFWGQATRIHGRGNLLLPRGWLAALAFSSFFGPFFWPVLGGSWAGNEYGWGTIRSILTRRPARATQALTALAVLLSGVLLGLIAILIIATGASLLVASFTGNASWTSGLFDGSFAATMLKGMLTAWYVSSFYLLLAYAAAVIARSAAVGIGFGIGSTLAEIVLRELFSSLGGVWNTIAEHFPFVYSQSMITRVVGSQLIPGTNLARVAPNTPDATQSLIALAIYAAILLAVLVGAVRMRDVTA
jgi:ABC-type transport system involved in multi-copper enzyme maturation permease subunit